MNAMHSAYTSPMRNSTPGIQKVGAIADSVRGTTYLAEIAYRVTALLYLLKLDFVSETYIDILFNTITILSGAEILHLNELQFKKDTLLTEKVEKGILAIKTLVDLVRGAHALKLINLGIFSLKIGKVAFLPISLMVTPIGILSIVLQFFADLQGLGTAIIKLKRNHTALRDSITTSQTEKFKQLKTARIQLIIQLSCKITRIAVTILGFFLLLMAPQAMILIFPFLVLGAISYSIRLFEFSREGTR